MDVVTAQLNLNSTQHHTPPTSQTFRALPGNLGSWFSVGDLSLTQLEEKWKMTSIFSKMEDNRIFFEKGWQPHFFKKEDNLIFFLLMEDTLQK